jgi:hypothetical protein
MKTGALDKKTQDNQRLEIFIDRIFQNFVKGVPLVCS